MKVIFRVDASLKIGHGHVIRCLCLAEALKENGAHVEFICRQHNGSLINKIRSNGFNVHELELLEHNKIDNKLFYSSWLGVTQQKDANDCIGILKTIKTDWLIVDHYGLDETWQRKLKSYYKKLMVVDDLGDRRHYCDLLLDQNFGSTQAKYHGLVDRNCKILLGSKYALLRAEFSEWRDYSLKRRENMLQVSTLLVTMGGVDLENYTEKVLQQLAKCKLDMNTEIQVVMWERSPHLKKVQKQASKMPFKTEVKTGVSNMAELMANADLAIGTTGSTTWERCYLGLPTIQLVISENQQQVAASLDKMKAIKLLEKLEDIIFFIETLEQWFLQVKENCKVIVHEDGVTLVTDQMKLSK